MVNAIRRLRRDGAVLLSSVAACLAAGSAYANCTPPPPWSPETIYNIGDVASYTPDATQPYSARFYQSQVNDNMGNAPGASPSQWNGNNILVCKFTVQPIDVCSNSANPSCPVINSMGQTAVTDPGTNLIGYIDPLTGLNAEQAAFGQMGISLAFAPVVLFKSPLNPNTTSRLTEPDYRWLHAQNCNTCSTGSTSPDLLTLTQQPGISQDASPTTPLNPNPTIPNLFFVKVIHPATPGIIIKGFSWDSNNGGAIASDTVFTAPFSVGTIAHELGHMAGLEHNTFGAGPLTCGTDTVCPENLMTAGSAPRQLPSGLIDSATNDCGASPGQACWVPQTPPQDTMPPNGLDLLTTGGTEACTIASLSQCPSQQAAVVLSNFMYSIPNTVSTVSQSAPAAAVAQNPTSSNTAATAQSSISSPPPCPPTATATGPCFYVSGLTGGSPGETLLAYIVMIPQPTDGSAQFTFSNDPFKIISQSRRSLLQDFDLQPLDDDVPYPPCAAANVLCGEVEFNRSKGKGFGPNDFMQFSLNILKGGVPATLADLCGAKVAFIFSDGYAPASALPCSGPPPLIATSLAQDPTTPPQVVTVSTAVIPTNTPACTPLPNGQCPNPMTTGVTDSNLATGAEVVMCTAGGNPIPCPPPPSP